ncbi:InlB B-repeat-containing protein [Paenibacillus sp. MBLB4367]|uniref:InlB B-repeat-containing protein n=1 Tax=Paenibacillus sp. MBLB4367 TaxID=3384767 RepID=UPI00390829F2
MYISHSREKTKIITYGPDITPPKATAFSPINTATNASTNSYMSIQFNEDVMKTAATGKNITIKKESDDSIAATAASISASGKSVGFYLSKSLEYNTKYYVQIDAGLIADVSGNAYGGFADKTTWSFTTGDVPDTTPPAVTAFSPANGTKNVALDSPLTLTFDENVSAAAGKNIVIKKTSDDTAIETIPANDTRNVTISDKTVTVTPSNKLSYSTAYYVQIESGSFKDKAGNVYAGIANKTAWSFTTVSEPDTTAPTLTAYTPAREADNVKADSNLTLTFSEDVTAGAGKNIHIFKPRSAKTDPSGSVVEEEQEVETIPATDSDRVKISVNTVTVDPKNNFQNNQYYFVLIDKDAFLDKAGNGFNGLSSHLTLFEGGPVEPDLATKGPSWYFKTASAYTVSFDSRGGSAVSAITNVASGSAIAEPTAPTRAGFTFEGWYKESSLTTAWNFATDKVTGDTMLYAKWKATSTAMLWVEFAANGGEFEWGSEAGQLVKYGTKLTEPSVYRNGYTFIGWYTDETYSRRWVFDSDTATEEFTMVARWSKGGDPNAPVVTSYSPPDNSRIVKQPDTKLTLTFNKNVKAIKGGKIRLKTPVYNFFGSLVSGGQEISIDAGDTSKVTVTGSKVVIDMIDIPADEYYVNIDVGTFRDESDIDYAGLSGDVTYNEYTDGSTSTSIKEDSSDWDFKIIEYRVNFDTQGGTPVPPPLRNVTPGSKITEPTAPTRSGYTFGGWYKDKQYTNVWNFATDTVSGSLTLYAKWIGSSPTTYTVSFDSQGGSAVAAIANVASGATITAPTAPARAGHTFVGWYKEASLMNAWNFATDKVTGNVTLYAKWTAAGSTMFTISFDSLGGSTVAPIANVASGSTISSPTAPTRTGYTFAGWYKEASLATAWNFAADKVTGDMTLFAKWISNGPIPAPGFQPSPEPRPGDRPGTPGIPNVPYGAGNHLLVKVSSSLIATPNVGDAVPSGAGVIDPYISGSDIPGTDPKVNRYIGLYEVDSSNKVVKFTLIILNPEDIRPGGTPAPGFDPKPEPRPGDAPGTPAIPDVLYGSGNHLLVKVSSSLIATPYVGDSAPSGAGVIDPYIAGSDIPGTDPRVNRYIGLYEVDKDNKVVKFTLIILNPDDIRPGAPSPIPAPGFNPKPVPRPGDGPGTPGIPDVNHGALNHLLVKVSSSLIATPNVGDAAPSGAGVIDPYVKGSDIPGADPKVNRFIGLYEVDGTNKVVKFTLIVLNPEDVNPGTPSPIPAPGFSPKPVPKPGGSPGTPAIPDIIPGTGNHLLVKVSSSLIATPNAGDTAPSEAGIINPYIAGSDIPGADPKVNRYIGFYEVTSDNKVVKFTLIILNPDDFNPGVPSPIPAPGFNPKPVPKPGTGPDTTDIPNVSPTGNNRLLVKVSSSLIETPNIGDVAPTGNDIIDPYTGGNIPGVDAKVQRYIGLYEVDGTNKVVKFTLIVLNPEDVNPGAPDPTPAPGFLPKPVPKPGTGPDTTDIPNVSPTGHNRLLVKVSSSLIETPKAGDAAPTGDGVIDPYTGGNIPGVDAKVKRYIGLYEVDGNNKVVKFTLIVLNPEDVNPGAPDPTPAPGFLPKPVPKPGTGPDTTDIPNVSPTGNNRLLVKVSSSLIETPKAGDAAPTGDGVIDPYTGGNIPGVDAKVNRYIGLYEVDGTNKVVKFTLIVLNPDDVNPGTPDPTPAPGFSPKPVPKPGTGPDTTDIPNVSPTGNNRLLVKVSSSLIETPKAGDAAPTGDGVIDPYTGGNIPGVDAKVKRYIGLYEVDGNNKVVKFTLIVLNPEDVNPGAPDPLPVPGFSPKPKPQPGTGPDTTDIPNVSPTAGNRLLVKVSNSLIETPNVGDTAPTGSGIFDPYSGGNIPGVDAKVNRYIGLYEVDGTNKVVKFTLIVLNPEDVTPGAPNPEPVPGFNPKPKPKPKPGTKPGTTDIPNVTPAEGNRLLVKVSSSLIETPSVGDMAPAGSGIIDPYTGGNISGVDAKVNRYVGFYEVDSSNKVVRFRLIVLNPEDINPGMDDLNNDFDKLGITYQEGDHAEHVTKTLYLAAKGQSGRTTVTWMSSNPELIKPNGRVTRPGVDDQDAYVILTATIKDEATGAQSVKTFTVKVIRMSDEDAVREAAKDLTVDKAFTFAPGDKWESVTSEFLMLDKGLHGTSITWTSSDSSTIDITSKDGKTNGSVKRPESSDDNVLLTAVIKKGNATITKTFLIIVKNKTVSKEENQTRQPTAKKAEATVNPDGSASRDEFTILRTTLTNGSKIDTVIVDTAKVEGLTDAINPLAEDESKRTVTLYVKQPSTDKADEIAIEIPAHAVAAMADRNALLEIKTDEGSVLISAEALKDSAEKGTDLYFRLVPVKDSQEQSEAKRKLVGNSTVQQEAAGKPINILSIPRKIETNFTGFATKVIIPLSGVSVPESNKQEFLNSLRVFIEHSDGTTELLAGVFQYENGRPTGIEIEINRFSRFQIVSFAGNGGSNGGSSNESGNESAAEFVPSPSLKPGSAYGTTSVNASPAGAGNRIVIRVSSGTIPVPNKGDAAPTGAGVIDPYVSGSDIDSVDAEGNKYIGIYEVDGNNRIVRFKLLLVSKSDLRLIDLLVNDDVQKNTAKLDRKKASDAEEIFIVVDNEAIIGKLSSEKAGSVLTVPQVSSAKRVEVAMNGQLLRQMLEKAGVFRFETEAAIYIVPAAALDVNGLLEQLGTPADLSKVTYKISVAFADKASSSRMEELAKNGDAKLYGSPVQFSIAAEYGGKIAKADKFDRYVERWIRLPKDIDPSQVTTGVSIATDGSMLHMPTRMESDNGTNYAVVSSLYNGQFALVNHKQAFGDTEGHWAEAAINELASRTVVNGTGERSFAPDTDMTRAEFAAIIVRALGLKLGNSGKRSFNDIHETDWYFSYVTTATEFGIVEGYETGDFGPTDRITREQAMVMIARAMSITGLKTGLQAGEADKLLAAFGDSEVSAEWARESIAASVKAGLVSGRSDGTISPKNEITRAEVVKLVTKLLQLSKLI